MAQDFEDIIPLHKGVSGKQTVIDYAPMDAALDRDLRERLHRSEAVLIAAGAGMGVDSGLPDFRGGGGFWRAYPILQQHGLCFEQMANPRLFRKRPELAWAFYGHRLALYRRTTPHSGFARLLEFCGDKPHFVVTSNVDQHFQKAGFDPRRIYEVHGSIMYWQCTIPCSGHIWPAPADGVDVDEVRFVARSLPRCPHCGHVARPNVLMFNDDVWLDTRVEAQRKRFQRWLDEIRDRRWRLLIVEIGAGMVIPTIRRIVERIYDNMMGCTLVRINPRNWHVPYGAFGLACGAREGIDRLFRRVSDEGDMSDNETR